MDLQHFIEQLAQAPTAPDAYNEYAYGPAANALRRHNLALYLHSMIERQPKTLLVMEAPGYRGCRLTGVPVTSRKILLEGVMDLFGTAQGYQDIPEPGFEQIQGEQSATIVWGTLETLSVVPLIWNTFPFHPHKPGQPLTNRKPRKDETTQGSQFLGQIITSFQPVQTIAVGNVAHVTLQAMGITASKIRHPAQGGKNEFVAGLTEVLTHG